MKKANWIVISYLIMISSSCFLANVNGQDIYKLPRNTPEAEGVSSSLIIDFLNAVDTGQG